MHFNYLCRLFGGEVVGLSIEHPDITRMNLKGYLGNDDREIYEYDVLGNAIYLYDDVIAMPEGIYRAENLSDSEIDQMLEDGGIYQQAK